MRGEKIHDAGTTLPGASLVVPVSGALYSNESRVYKARAHVTKPLASCKMGSELSYQTSKSGLTNTSIPDG